MNATGFDLAQAALVVLTTCVKSPINQVGVAGKLGLVAVLAIRIVPYEAKVACTDVPGRRPPPVGSCRNLLDMLPASYDHKKFGPHHASGVDVGLLQSLMERKACPFPIITSRGLIRDTTAEKRCVIGANSSMSATVANWYIIYLAATAVDAMCVRRGLAGTATDIGLCKSWENGHSGLKLTHHFLADNGNVFVTISNENPLRDAIAVS